MLQHEVPGALVVAGEKAEVAPEPVFQMIGLEQPNEFQLQQVLRTEDGHASGQRQHPAGKRV